jgi:hypothetical protein
MPINPNIPLQAANIPQIRYQPESQFESFAKIQPTLNAMQQMRTQAVESQEKARGQQVLQKMRADLGPNFDPEQVGLYLLKNGANQAQMQLGLNLYKASQDEKASQRPTVVAPGSALVSPAGKELYRPPVDQKPKLEKVSLGDRMAFVDVNPSSPTFQQEVMSQAMGAAPGAAEARGPEIVQLMRARDALPAGSPDRALVQARIDKLNAPSAGVTIQMPVPVYDSKTGQTTYVTREEAIGKTPASAAPKPAEAPSVSETQAATATARLLQRAKEISTALENTPQAEAPSAVEAGLLNLPGLSAAANLVRSTDRQIVASAQDDILDALLYLATGAAYNKEQLQQQKSGYLASWSDDPRTRSVKRQRLVDMIGNAKIRAGKAWTPELDSQLNLLLESPAMRQQNTGGAATGAAMYARNPKTGERIMSVDGGNTWTPAR